MKTIEIPKKTAWTKCTIKGIFISLKFFGIIILPILENKERGHTT